jgi:hypothetical protein
LGDLREFIVIYFGVKKDDKKMVDLSERTVSGGGEWGVDCGV